MAKDKISQYSTTNALNTDIGGIDIDENCLPSNLNDAIREVMVQLREFQNGSSGDPLTITGTITSTTIKEGTANVVVQTDIGTAPNEIPLNQYLGNLAYQDAENIAGDVGVGGDLEVGGTINDSIKIDASGNVGISTSSPAFKLDVSGITRVLGGSASSATFGSNQYIRLDTNANGGFTVGAPSSGAITTGYYFTSGAVSYAGGVEYQNTTNALSLRTNNTVKATITSAGSVGIGTSSANKSSSSTALTVNAPSAANYAALELSSGDTLNWHINSNNAAVYDVTGGTRPRIFYTNGSERLRIDSSGNVGIGTSLPDTSPSTKLHIREDDAVDYKARAVVQAADQRLVAGSHYQFGVQAYSYLQSTNDAENVPNNLLLNPDGGNVGIATSSPSAKFHIVGSTYDYLIGFGANEDNYYSCGSSGVHIFRNGATEAARFTASGNLLVDRTSAYSDGNLGTPTFQVNAVVGVRAAAAFIADTTGAVNSVGFVNPNGTVGTISVIGTTTAYNTSSDYRLKENVAPMTGALATVAQLNPVTYNWKADGSSGQGFIAHELQAVVPDAVTGEKDAVDKDGKPIHQGVDTSFLVATLTAAIQELSAKVDTLQAELNTLKGN